jgi:hypothetical protein
MFPCLELAAPKMIVRLLLLERFFFWHCWRWDTFTKRLFLDNHHLFVRTYCVSGRVCLVFIRIHFTTRDSGQGEHASTIQKGKMERTSALFVDSACLALRGTRDSKTSFFGTRDMVQRKGLIINIGRRWDDRDGILKRDGFEGALHVCVCV